ncbi:MAG: M1 family aminopeptidase [Acidimicrobiia bacterium]
MTRRAPIHIAFLLLLIGCVTNETASEPSDQPDGLGDPVVPWAGNVGYDAIRYQWDLIVDPAAGTLDAVTVMEAVGTKETPVLSLDFSGPTPSRVVVNGQVTEFEHHPPKLLVSHPTEPGEELRVEIDFEGNPEPHTPAGFPGKLGWIHQADLVYSSAVLPGDTATWAPLNDTPLDPAIFSVLVSTPRGMGAVASGTPTETAGITRWETLLPVTEFGFAAGELQQRTLAGDPLITFSAIAGLSLPSEPWDERLPELVEFLEGFLGPFPFATLGLTQVTGLPGGNSTPGQIFLGMYEEELIAHELGHQWIGGSVSTASSRDVWLREGVPEYLAYAWIAERDSTSLDDRMQSIHTRLGRETRALLDVDEPADRGDDATYLRGALAFHALRKAVGDRDFRAGLMSFTAEYSGRSATTESFIEAIQKHTEVAVAEILGPWIEQEEMPPVP